MIIHVQAREPIPLYYSFAAEDRALLDQLDKHLASSRRQKLISTWHDGLIPVGNNQTQATTHYLKKARIALLLVSPDYIANDDCYEQMEQLVARHKAGTIQIVPILLRPTQIERTPIEHLSLLPMKNRPVTSWSSRDEAFVYIANEVRNVSEQLIIQQEQRQHTTGILLLDPPHLHSTILQRTTLVKTIYHTLLQPEISGLVLTGLKGVGKSMLAAQIFHHAEEHRLRGEGPFIQKALWLKVEATGTIKDLTTILATALKLPMHIDYSPSRLYQSEDRDLTTIHQALELFKIVAQSKCLIILDQFEELLENNTGTLPAQHAAIAEWLTLLNEHANSSRILFTSSIYPQIKYIKRNIYMQEFTLDGLGVEEGCDLLRLWGVDDPTKDLARAIERCKGHIQALVLLENLLHSHKMSLTTILDNPAYGHLWSKDIQHNLLAYIYKYQLQDETQRQFLEAVAIYREAVPWQAVRAIMDRHMEHTQEQILNISGFLQRYHFLQTYQGNDERYELHPLVRDFIHEMQIDGKNYFNVHSSHEAAAHYYEQNKNVQTRYRDQQNNDTHSLTEIAWHYLQAEKWEEGYILIKQENLFHELQRQGKDAILLELYAQLLPLERWQPTSDKAIDIHNEIGEIYSRLGHKREAQYYQEKALTLCKLAGNREKEIKVLNDLGAIYHINRQIFRALECYQEAKRLSATMPDHPQHGITFNNIGRILQSQGQQEKARRKSNKHYRQALLCYKQALTLHKAAGDGAEMARTFSNLGEISVLLQQTEKAYSYYQQALKYFRESGEKQGEGIVCNNLGIFYRMQNKIQQGMEYYLQALHIFRIIGDRWQEGVTLRNIGRIYLLLPQQEVALACFLLVQEIYEELHYPDYGAIPKEIRRIVVGAQSFDLIAEQVRPRAFRIVEDTLKFQNVDFSE